MALSEEQKNKIVVYLGYTITSIMPGSTDFTRLLVARLTTLTPWAETEVANLLTQIESVKTKMAGSSGRMLVKKVGDIELNPDEHRHLGREYRRLLKELSSMLGIPSLSTGISVVA